MINPCRHCKQPTGRMDLYLVCCECERKIENQKESARCCVGSVCFSLAFFVGFSLIVIVLKLLWSYAEWLWRSV